MNLKTSTALSIAVLSAGFFPARSSFAEVTYFRRGDANGDSRRDLTDGVFTLGFVFLGGSRPPCDDAADVNDDGSIDVSDGIFLLAYLFLGGPQPPAPGGTCGFDPIYDHLSCREYPGCEQPQVEFEPIDGYAVIEGDIVIDKVREIPLKGRRLVEASVIVYDGNRFWPDGVVYYEIDPALTHQQRVLDAISHWERNTSITFLDRQTEPDYLTFQQGSGCYSSIGRVGGKQVIGVDDGCSTGNVIHEIGHALGLFHEQARSDRDDHVQIFWNNIEPGKEYNFQKPTAKSESYCSPYDFGSIMHYPRTAFTRNGAPTIETIPPGKPIGQRNGLSPEDVALIEFVYAQDPFWTQWTDLGAPDIFNTTPGAGQYADGSVALVARTTEGNLLHTWQVAPDGWVNWVDLGGGLIGKPAVGLQDDGTLEVFQRGPTGMVWHNREEARGAWQGWYGMPMVAKSNVAIGRNSHGGLEIFAVGQDDALWHSWQYGPYGPWSDWISLGGGVIGDPAVGQNVDGRLEVFQRGFDGNIYHNWQLEDVYRWDDTSTNWSGWVSLGGISASNVAVARDAHGALQVFAIRPDGTLWVSESSGRSSWLSLGGDLDGDPVVGADGEGTLEVFVRGKDQALWHSRQTGAKDWPGIRSLGGVLTSNPAVGRNTMGRLEVFARGRNHDVMMRRQRDPGECWPVN